MTIYRTTPGAIISSLNKLIVEKYPSIKNIVYDPVSSFETALELLRSQKSLNDDFLSPKSTLPLLGWNREPISSIGLKSAGKVFRFTNLPKATITFSPVAIAYQATIYTSSMYDLEIFESDWYSGVGINTIVEGKIDILGDGKGINYYIIWENDLESITSNIDGTYYKSMSVVARIYTVAVVINSLDDPNNSNKFHTIESFDVSLYDCDGKKVSENTITSEELING